MTFPRHSNVHNIAHTVTRTARFVLESTLCLVLLVVDNGEQLSDARWIAGVSCATLRRLCSNPTRCTNEHTQCERRWYGVSAALDATDLGCHFGDVAHPTQLWFRCDLHGFLKSPLTVFVFLPKNMPTYALRCIMISSIAPKNMSRYWGGRGSLCAFG